MAYTIIYYYNWCWKEELWGFYLFLNQINPASFITLIMSFDKLIALGIDKLMIRYFSNQKQNNEGKP
jgi:hypothetical protein